MIKSKIEGLTDEQYRSKIKCHAKSYRKKLIINSDKIREHFYNNEIPQDKKSLGYYRHFNVYTNQDEIVNLITKKWEDTYPTFCSDLLHSTQNKCNDLILRAILLGPINEKPEPPRIKTNSRKPNK